MTRRAVASRRCLFIAAVIVCANECLARSATCAYIRTRYSLCLVEDFACSRLAYCSTVISGLNGFDWYVNVIRQYMIA